MKWHKESRETYVARVFKWHSWFAWFPVQIGEERYWLTTVERKASLMIYDSVIWEYRLRSEP